MERIGLNKDRLQLAWMSAAEGQRFSSKKREMQNIVNAVTKIEMEKTIRGFRIQS